MYIKYILFYKHSTNININNKPDKHIYQMFLNNKFLVTMPNEMINPLQLSVYGKFNYNEPTIDCYTNINTNSLYDSFLQELKQNIKLTPHFKNKSEQILHNINTNKIISTQWKKT